jgi:hypothetical protein
MKCNYYSGGVPMAIMFEEYLVTFKCLSPPEIKPIVDGAAWPPDGENWCIVRQEDVRPLEGISGLVKIAVSDVDWDKQQATVRIFNAPDNINETFVVPVSEIVKKDSS